MKSKRKNLCFLRKFNVSYVLNIYKSFILSLYGRKIHPNYGKVSIKGSNMNYFIDKVSLQDNAKLKGQCHKIMDEMRPWNTRICLD
jgi:hypothetical protein